MKSFLYTSALCIILLFGSGAVLAEGEIQTVTGKVAIEQGDAQGDAVVAIVTETEKFIVSDASKASDISSQSGKRITAKGVVEVTEAGKTISVDEYALAEDAAPPVAAE